MSIGLLKDGFSVQLGFRHFETEHFSTMILLNLSILKIPKLHAAIEGLLLTPLMFDDHHPDDDRAFFLYKHILEPPNSSHIPHYHYILKDRLTWETFRKQSKQLHAIFAHVFHTCRIVILLTLDTMSSIVDIRSKYFLLRMMH